MIVTTINVVVVIVIIIVATTTVIALVGRLKLWCDVIVVSHFSHQVIVFE